VKLFKPIKSISWLNSYKKIKVFPENTEKICERNFPQVEKKELSMSHIMKMELPEVANFGFDKERDTLIASFHDGYAIVGINDPCFDENPFLDNLFLLAEKEDKSGYIYINDGLDAIKNWLFESVTEADQEKVLKKIMSYLENRKTDRITH